MPRVGFKPKTRRKPASLGHLPGGAKLARVTFDKYPSKYFKASKDRLSITQKKESGAWVLAVSKARWGGGRSYEWRICVNGHGKYTDNPQTSACSGEFII